MDKMQEKKILNACVEQLRKITPVKKVASVKKGLKANSPFADAIIDVHTETGKERFQIEIKGTMKRPLPYHLALQKGKAKHQLLLMSEYINPSIGSDLKNNHINFIDSLGNAFIHVPNTIFIERTGKKPAAGSVSKEPSVFQPKGMQLLFILLTIDGALNQTVRTLAGMSGISKDRAASVIRDLIGRRYLYEAKKRDYRFTKKKDLLEK